MDLWVCQVADDKDVDRAATWAKRRCGAYVDADLAATSAKANIEKGGAMAGDEG